MWRSRIQLSYLYKETIMVNMAIWGKEYENVACCGINFK